MDNEPSIIGRTTSQSKPSNKIKPMGSNHVAGSIVKQITLQ